MRGKNAQRVYWVVGVGLAILMGLSLFAPALAPTTQPQADIPEPTNTPAPTPPPPITDFSGISFTAEEYLHPSGLFAVSVPTGWEPSAPVNSGVQAQASMNNPNALSVVEASLQKPDPLPDTLDALSAIYTRNFLSGSWARYSSWEELSRRNDEENNRLLIDFRLERQGQTFLARQASWFDEDYVYLVRVVAPDNMIDLMNFMLEEMLDEIRVQPQFIGTPLIWNGYFDPQDQHILRYPQEWQITDEVAGGPTSIESRDGARLRVEARADDTVGDEEAATAFVESLLPGAQVLTAQPVTRNDAESGFSVSYQLPDPDGAPQSGLAVLLNGADGQLHIANGLVANTDVDFNAIDATAEAAESDDAEPTPVNPMVTDFAAVMETFSLLTGLNLPEPEPEPTPVPTEEPVEATEEAAAEMTEEPEAEATEEAAAEMTEEPEAEATEDAAPEATEDAGE